MISLKAAVLDTCTTDRPFSDSQPLVLETIHADGPMAHEVLVRIDAASLCRSDLSVITGVRPWPMPIVPGHEASGIVEETGTDVDGFFPATGWSSSTNPIAVSVPAVSQVMRICAPRASRPIAPANC